MNYRSSYSFAPVLTPAVRLLLIGTAAAFPVQVIADLLTAGGFTFRFSLSLYGLSRLELWQPATYLFLHGGLLHLILNLLGLFFFGPETERAIGARRFMALYFICGILAGLGWIVISGTQAGYCLGASGAIFGVLGTFAGLFPQRPVTLLVFFVIPVTMRARTLAIALGLFSLLAIISQPGHIAYAAHLVGGLAGYVYGRYLVSGQRRRGPFSPRRWLNDLLWNWQRRKFKVMRGSARDWNAATDQTPTPQDVDEVLAKISKWGLGRLTKRDREILDWASRRK